MIDIAWSEFFFITLIALILIGPKELPTVLRFIGKWVGKARAFAKDISAQLDLTEHMYDSKNAPKVTQNNLPPDQEETQTHENKQP